MAAPKKGPVWGAEETGYVAGMAALGGPLGFALGVMSVYIAAWFGLDDDTVRDRNGPEEWRRWLEEDRQWREEQHRLLKEWLAGDRDEARPDTDDPAWRKARRALYRSLLAAWNARQRHKRAKAAVDEAKQRRADGDEDWWKRSWQRRSATEDDETDGDSDDTVETPEDDTAARPERERPSDTSQPDPVPDPAPGGSDDRPERDRSAATDEAHPEPSGSEPQDAEWWDIPPEPPPPPPDPVGGADRKPIGGAPAEDATQPWYRPPIRVPSTTEPVPQQRAEIPPKKESDMATDLTPHTTRPVTAPAPQPSSLAPRSGGGVPASTGPVPGSGESRAGAMKVGLYRLASDVEAVEREVNELSESLKNLYVSIASAEIFASDAFLTNGEREMTKIARSFALDTLQSAANIADDLIRVATAIEEARAYNQMLLATENTQQSLGADGIATSHVV